jgi:hypothetical protein
MLPAPCLVLLYRYRASICHMDTSHFSSLERHLDHIVPLAAKVMLLWNTSVWHVPLPLSRLLGGNVYYCPWDLLIWLPQWLWPLHPPAPSCLPMCTNI